MGRSLSVLHSAASSPTGTHERPTLASSMSAALPPRYWVTKLPDCGNFNGSAADDDRMAVRQRVGTQGVPVGPELLFTTKTPVTAADRPDINNCPTATLDAAKADCKATFGGVSPKMSCLTDYCFAGKEVALNK